MTTDTPALDQINWDMFTVVEHPLVQHKLTLMRRTGTSSKDFRQLLREISQLLAYEVMRDLETEQVSIETPLEHMDAPMLSGKKLCVVPIPRAGTGLLDGFLDLLPSARVGHIGLYRDPRTLSAVEYFIKMPEDLDQRLLTVVDPMLATGNSAIAAVTRLKELGGNKIKFVCLVCAPEGVVAMQQAHPDIQIYAAGLDRELNDHGYIMPGLGDAGDRIFGTT